MLGQGLVKFWSLASLCFQTPTFLSAFLQPGGCRLVHGWEGEECVRRFSLTVSIFVQQSQFLADSLNFYVLVSIFVWSSQFLAGNLNFCLAVSSIVLAGRFFCLFGCFIFHQPNLNLSNYFSPSLNFGPMVSICVIFCQSVSVDTDIFSSESHFLFDCLNCC